MKLFLLNIAIIVTIVLLMFATTLLLDWNFIQGALVRELLVYLVMLLEAGIGFLIWREANKTEANA